MRIQLDDDTPTLDVRRKAWYTAQKLRYNKKHKNRQATFSQAAQLEQPPEYLRKIIKDHGDLSSARYQTERTLHKGAVKYLPWAMFKLLQNMPQPFELSKFVQVIYHTSGAITFIDETPRVIPPVYIAQWAATWIRMRVEKSKRKNFSRISLPPFNSEEPIVDFGDNLAVISSQVKPVQLALDQMEDDSVFDFFYESSQPLKNDLRYVNGPSYRKYHLTVPIMSNLYRLARPFLLDIHGQSYTNDPNRLYLFNRDAFITAKSLSQKVPNGPSFEPLYREEENDSWTEFNDLYKLISRRAVATEYRIALPYVYNNNPRSILPQVSQYPLSCRIDDNDDNLSILESTPYEFDRAFYPVQHHTAQTGFVYVPMIRKTQRTKHQENIAFLQSFYAHCNELRFGDQIDASVAERAVIEPIPVDTHILDSYGPNYHKYQQFSYSRYLSDDSTLYPAEFILTTASSSPFYAHDKYTLLKLLQECANVQYYTYPGCDKSLWLDNSIVKASPQELQSFSMDSLYPSRYEPNMVITDMDSAYYNSDDVHYQYNGNHFSSPSMTDSNDNDDNDNSHMYDFEPMFQDFPLYQQTQQVNTLAGLMLYQAPAPFNTNHGTTVSAHHMDLVKNWYIKRQADPEHPAKVRLSYQKLLKRWVLNQIHHKKEQTYNKFSSGTKYLFKLISQQKTFQRTTVEWLEAAVQCLRQGYNMLSLLVRNKRINYLHLDFNFTLQATRVLSTKERKFSRFGASFHLIREILKLLKIVVDCHIKHRLGDIDGFQLADALQYTFSHVGLLTGIYRYKYRTTRQIRQCKDLKHLIYYKFNTASVQKGPGVGFWHPSWRVWVFFLQGIAPLLENWLKHLLDRQSEGRVSGGDRVFGITKQRVESVYDAELKRRIHLEILDMMPKELREANARIIAQHMSDAWRCWRSNKPWKIPGLPIQVEEIILRFVKSKADHWITHAYRVRERLKRGEYLEKTVVKKNLGRLSRLALKSEGERQLRYLSEGPFISENEASAIITTTVHWLESRKYLSIPPPAMNYRHDTKVLTLALDKLKEKYLTNAAAKISTAQRQELTLIQQGHDNVEETTKRIKSMILNARSFKDIEIEYYDEYNVLTPVYEINPVEKITDMYLDQYLWYEGTRRGLFPDWVKPGDAEPPPFLAYKTCQNINNYDQIWSTEGGACTVLLQTQFSKVFDNIDLTLLNRILSLIMDPILADYIIARYNTRITYKDMTHTNSIGIIRGIAFSSFVMQYYGLVLDLLILGLQRASQLAGPPALLNKFGHFSSANTPQEALETERAHPIRMYCRYIDRIYILFKLEGDEVQDLVHEHLSLYPDPNNNNIHTYPTKSCWPRDCRMRLMRNDVNLGKAIFYFIKNRIPLSLSTIEWSDSYTSVYSLDNPQLLFNMFGFEIRLIPALRQKAEYQLFSLRSATWSLLNRNTQETTAYAYTRVEEIHVRTFENRVRHMLMTAGNATYIKIAQKWNSLITALMTYYREAVPATTELLDLIVRCENKVQTRIKVGLNSKMPQRFPPVVFYSTPELGGLGMLSMGNILVPESDRIYGKESGAIGTTHFRAGMQGDDGPAIPVLHRYIVSWETEFVNSERAWQEFFNKNTEAQNQQRRLGLNDLQDILNKGIPRINTLFSKDRQTLSYDRGWRVRLEWRKYTTAFHNNYWWTNARHDGRLWSFTNYRTDVIQSLGGVESILEHTLFKATYFKTWEGVFWEKKTSFEDSLKLTRLTKAQSQGLSQVPNRRFVLWWSPTINRADVYIGYTVQLDLTGIFMHGKLPVLKVAYVSIFRAHLWQKIHEAIVLDLCDVINSNKDRLELASVEKEAIQPRKSYKMQSSCADIKLSSIYKWDYTCPYLINTREELMRSSGFQQDTYWIDIQLRWGDYDQHDIESYTRGKYIEYTSDADNNIYPSPAGVMIAVDLAYNIWSAYGSYIPNLSALITKTMARIMKSNSALFMLRERVRKAVQLYTSEPTEPFLNSSNYGELFRSGAGRGANVTWFIDSSAVYRVTQHRTEQGNYTTKPINGALVIFNPTNGELYLKVIHTSAWTGQKRITQLAKWKTAEETAALIRPLPPEQRPTQLIIAQSALLDPIQNSCLDFANMVIKGSELSLPFQSILKLTKIGDIVASATESRLIVFSLYDDWLQTTTQSYTCFSRLLLLLRALHINQDRTNRILYPNATVIAQKGHTWPTLNTDEWANVETQLRDLILADFSMKNNVSIESLTQSEIRDIILGAQIQSPTDQRQQFLEDLDKSNNRTDITTTVNVQTLDKYGNLNVTAVSSNYERTQFISSNDWRIQYVSTQQLYNRSKHVSMVPSNSINQDMKFTQNNITYIIPQTLFRQFTAVSDIKTITCAYMYGIVPKKTDEKGTQDQLLTTSRLIQCLVVPPQNGTSTTILYTNPPVSNPSSDLPQSNITASIANASKLSQFIPLGIIYTIGQQDSRFLAPAQCVQHCKWYDYISSHHNLQHIQEQSPDGKLETLFNLQSTTTITVAYAPGTCTLNSFTISPDGYQWYKSSPNAKIDSQGQIVSESDYSTQYFYQSAIQITNRVYGYFMSPLDQVWNYSFTKLRYKADLLTIYTITPPIPFYHYKHRRAHFLNFVKFGQQQQQQAANASAQDAIHYDTALNQLEDEFYQ